MSTPESVLAQIDELIGLAEDATGQSFDNLTDAVAQLCEGYGTGSGDVGEEEPCSHETTTIQYISAGNGQHTVNTVCSVCGEVVSEMEEACTDETGDGLCDLCGAAVDTGGEESCSHVNTTTEYTSSGDGSHTVKTICADCGTVISEKNVKCSSAPDSATIMSNGDGTHTSVTVCSVCENTMTQVIGSCEDADGDGLCDVCGAQMDAGENDDVWEYTSGSLSGEYQRYFSVSGGVLVYQETTSYGTFVAVGAAPAVGTTPCAIKLPSSATKLTITFGKGSPTSVDLLLFNGTAEAVTESEVKNSAVTDGIAEVTLTAGQWKYVVFNVRGIGLATIGVQVAENMTLKLS